MVVDEFCALKANGCVYKTRIKKEKKLRRVSEDSLKTIRFDEKFDCLFSEVTEPENLSNNYVTIVFYHTMKLKERRKKTFGNFDDERNY